MQTVLHRWTIPVVFAIAVLFFLPLHADREPRRAENSQVVPEEATVEQGRQPGSQLTWTGNKLPVGEGQQFIRLQDAIDAAVPGDTIELYPGVYREWPVEVNVPVKIRSRQGAVNEVIFDAEGKGELVVVTANDVVIDGITFRNTESSHVRDFAALRFAKVEGGEIRNSIFENNFFGIYLAEAKYIQVEDNIFESEALSETSSANGIHLWSCDFVDIKRNDIRGHRDGIYLEFVRHANIEENTVENSLRYGLHFMFSDDSKYTGNVFRHNSAGAAVMYTNRVIMKGNIFADNWGAAAYGLLLKDINHSTIEDNILFSNSTALHIEGSNHNSFRHNRIQENGWAIRIMASSADNTFSRNSFVENSFDVATNSRTNFSTFSGNYWSHYSGYDLSGDGFGDVPYRPVRLFSYIVEKNPIALILLRSIFIDILEVAERILPVLTPETLIDEKPLMEDPLVEKLL